MRFSRARKAAIAVTTVLFASLLTVAAPAAATAAGTSSISGAVQADVAASTPLANSYVTLYAKSGSSWAYKSYVRTDSAGAYSFANLDAGTYTLQFEAPSGSAYVDEWWNNKAARDQATAITLAAGAWQTGLTAKLTLGGTVTGKISSALALEYPYVFLLEPDQPSGYYRWKSTSYGASADASGNYTITGVRPGTYTAAFSDFELDSVALQFFDRTDNITLAKSFKVTSGGTVSSVNATLIAGVTVSGKVTDSAGKALNGALVQIARKITVDGKPFWEYDVQSTSANGTYSTTGLAPGTFAVKVYGPSGQGYSEAFYGGGTSFETSKTFPLSSGQSRGGVDVKLTKKLAVGTPSITGSAVVGSTLKVKAGTWTKGTRFSYQWYAAGRAISKATSSSFKVTSAQRGKNITVRVTGTLPTYASGYKVSKATLKVAAAATPKISGTAKVGKKLTAKPGTWTSGTKFTYQWYANGKAIKKATKSAFTITKSQKAKKITVKVTGKKSGHTTVSKVSKATKKVG